MHKVAKSQEIQGFEKIKGDKNTMIKVLFLCHGNICRSPMAEFVFADMAKRRGVEEMFYVDSAATSREEIGNPVHPGTVRKLKKEGVPMYPHRAKQITFKDYEYFDYIIVMEQYNITNLKRVIGEDTLGKVHTLLSFTAVEGDIADPWYTGNFDVTYDDIVKGCTALLDELIKINGEI